MNKKFLRVFFLFLVFPSSAVWAQNVRFGAEWTFTNDQLIKEAKLGGNYSVSTQANTQARDKLIKKLLKKCDGCWIMASPNKYFSDEPKYRLNFNSEVWVEIDIDPWVIEINTHARLDEYLKNEDYYKRVFEMAKAIGLSPHKRIGGGHIHVDFASAFQNSELKARNFIVDMFNNPELALGLTGKDFLNAAPLAMLSQSQNELFAEELNAYDSGKTTFDQFINAINEKVYQSSYDSFDPEPSNKYQAVNLLRASSKSSPRTIELRFFRPPKDFSQYIMQLQLISSRIRYLASFDRRIEFVAKNYRDKRPDKKALVKFYEDFLQETELSFSKFSSLLPKGLMATAKSMMCEVLFEVRQ